MSFCYGFCYIPVCAPMIDWKIAVGFMLKLKNEFDWMNDENREKMSTGMHIITVMMNTGNSWMIVAAESQV